MKRILLAAMLMCSGVGCTTSTSRGYCVGLASEDETNPQYKYTVAKENVILAIIFSETFIIPGYVAAFDYKCPTSNK